MATKAFTCPVLTREKIARYRCEHLFWRTDRERKLISTVVEKKKEKSTDIFDKRYFGMLFLKLEHGDHGNRSRIRSSLTRCAALSGLSDKIKIPMIA